MTEAVMGQIMIHFLVGTDMNENRGTTWFSHWLGGGKLDNCPIVCLKPNVVISEIPTRRVNLNVAGHNFVTILRQSPLAP